jgi:hypothetical protein
MIGLRHFYAQLRRHPLRALLGLAYEYAGYVAACIFALVLLSTRWPLGLLDRSCGLHIRDRLIDLVSRASPG